MLSSGKTSRDSTGEVEEAQIEFCSSFTLMQVKTDLLRGNSENTKTQALCRNIDHLLALIQCRSGSD
jgi:hypothetical protein